MKKQEREGATRLDLIAYAAAKYKSIPEYPWIPLPNYCVLRRGDNKKWYSIIMDVPKYKLGMEGEERTDIAVIKCDQTRRDRLLEQPGFLPAYHLDSANWITVLLDGTVAIDTVLDLLDQSYVLAKTKSKKAVRIEPTSWLVPVNPKYYDIEKAFAQIDTIEWKQSNTVLVGDTIYLYVAAPYSCVMYRCVAVEVDIPYEYDDGNVHMHKVMKIKRLHTYDRDQFGLAVLNEHGILSVRGPRGIPYGLLYKLQKESDYGA